MPVPPLSWVMQMNQRPLAALLVLAVACDSGTDPSRGRLQEVEGLTPGATARISGRGLSSLQTLTVQGVAVSELVVESDGAVSFRVPVLRACETDGRLVTLLADGTDSLRAPLDVSGTVTMETGETRILSASELQCLRFSRRDEDFVLSAAGLGIPDGDNETLRAALLLRTWTESTSQPQWLEPFASVTSAQPVERHPPQSALAAPAAVVFSENPTPFDSRYATAQVGDNVTMVAWGFDAAQNQTLCGLPKAQVPTYQARVVAATQRIVIIVDTRSQYANAFLTGNNAWLQQGAQMADAALLPAVRSVIDPAFEPLKGGGGRYYVLLGSLGGGTGFAYDGFWPGTTGGSQAVCPHASEMTTARLNAAVWSEAERHNPQLLATTIIHEYAHNAEARIHLAADRPTNSSWYLNEAWASVVEESAARLASNQPTGARPASVTTSMPYSATPFFGLWGRMPRTGPWQFNGRYSVSATMLMYMRELVGEVSTGPRTSPTLHDRIYAQVRDWTDRPATIPLLAAEVGIPYEKLVDDHAFAAVTAGLLPAAVIAQRQLPHFKSWNFSELATQGGPRSAAFEQRLSRTTNHFVEINVADGGFGAVYLMGDGERGISVENLRQQPHASTRVRLTRLR